MAVGRLVGFAAGLGLILSMVGCSHRVPGECTVACAADGSCPDGDSCRADGYCHAEDDTAVCREGEDLPDSAPPSDSNTSGDASCDGEVDRIADSDTMQVTIPDGVPAGVDRTITFDSTCVTVETVQVHVEITHPYRGDVEIELTSPDGDSEVLLKSSEDANPDIVATFDASLPGGGSADGAWVLNVSDVFETDVGTLDYWSIGINMPAPAP